MNFELWSWGRGAMAGWDQKFASILQETEHSLARVKSQLRSPVTRRHDSSLTNSSGVRGRIHSPPPHLQRCHDSSSLVSLLSGRVHEQQKEISALRESVDYLQSTVQEQNRQIRTLKDEMVQIQKRLSESAADLRTGRELKQFKTEVSQELELLRRRHVLHSTHGPSPSQGDGLTTIAQELHSSRRILNEEIDSLQRDLTLMKSRQVNHESEVTTWSSSIKDLERQQDRLARTLFSLQDWQRTVEQQNGHPTRSTFSPSQMSHLIAAIDHRITSLEHKLLQTRSSPVNSEPLTYSMLTNNPLHLTTKRKTSLSEDSLHLSQDVSHDTLNIFSDSDGELTADMLGSTSSLDSTT